MFALIWLKTRGSKLHVREHNVHNMWPGSPSQHYQVGRCRYGRMRISCGFMTVTSRLRNQRRCVVYTRHTTCRAFHRRKGLKEERRDQIRHTPACMSLLHINSSLEAEQDDHPVLIENRRTKQIHPFSVPLIHRWSRGSRSQSGQEARYTLDWSAVYRRGNGEEQPFMGSLE